MSLPGEAMPHEKGLDEGKLLLALEASLEAAALGGQAPWRLALEQIAEACGAGGVLLLPSPGAPFQPIWSPSLDEAVEYGLKTGWLERNPRIARGVQVIRKPTDIITETDSFSEEELKRLPFNAEFITRWGMKSYAAGFLAPSTQAPVYFSIERRIEQGHFSTTELSSLRRVLPILQQAGRLAVRLADAHGRGALSTMSALGCAALLIDSSGMAVDWNEEAEAVAAENAFRIALNRRLIFQSNDIQSRFDELVGDMCANPVVSVSRRPTAIPLKRADRAHGRTSTLIIRVFPVIGSARDIFSRAQCLVTISGDGAPSVANPATLLRQAFGLTNAEAKVALLITNGHDLAGIAHGNGVSIGTVRSQVKSIFSKTDTRKQAELAATLRQLLSL